ncbi:hypothetical protein [Frankia sp. Cas4]|uniref:hypothetical protein n=1 Tax=Frankia sp. Cas4 TaxID=3073927 RepID=UPI002AD545FF|nr:hypothetical protein [Frankia sp. Cas4]
MGGGWRGWSGWLGSVCVSSLYVGGVPWSVGSGDPEDRYEPVGSGDLHFFDEGFDEGLALEILTQLDDRLDVLNDRAKGGAGRHDRFVVDLFGGFGAGVAVAALGGGDGGGDELLVVAVEAGEGGEDGGVDGVGVEAGTSHWSWL